MCNCNFFLTLKMRKYRFPSLSRHMLIYMYKSSTYVANFFSLDYSFLQKMQLQENSF